MCSYEYSRSFKNSFFYRTTRVAAFKLSFSIKKESLTKKISGEIAYELACFIYKYKRLQVGQLPWQHLFFLQNLLNFIITKYFKQVNDNLSICVYEHSPCGLSISGDIKICKCHVIKSQWCYYPQWRSVLSTSMTELFLLPKLDHCSPSVTRDKDICYVIIS